MLKAKHILWGLLGPLAFCLAGCDFFSSSVTDAAKTEIFYKRDMRIEVNGKVFEGMGVVPVQEQYNFVVDAKGTLNLLAVHNCHRELSREQAFEKGLFKDKSRAKFSVILFDEEESEFSCPLHFGGYEIKGGRHSWGLIEFQSKEMALVASLKCNGAKQPYTGVGVCQAREGTFQFLTFTQEVIQAESTCPKWETKDEKRFQIQMVKGPCTYRFKAKDIIGHEFRITTYGYEQILVREL